MAATAPSELLARGTVVAAQYRIERVLGHGGMGVVYLAHDLRLDRDIALKIARDRSPTALAQLSREALTLARLSHPNVVVIYQVGVYEDCVYVAMEYVRGTTARRWAAESRSVREIVALYIAVGGGLAAAHAAGIVHHDFKPDNILVGDDGRARVADFGLARTATEAELGAHIAGTPAFMAPEQLRGESVDHRADQYAFCVSLWQALHQSLPFDSDSVATITVPDDAAPRPAEPPTVGKALVPIPRHIEVALRRGMSNDRDARWPSMAPLLDELARDPGRRRRLALAIALPVISAAALVGVMWPASEPATDPCTVGPDRIARLWSPSRTEATRAALTTKAAPWLTRAATNAITGVDAWTARWATQYRAVCQETAWTPALRDRGFGCLSHGEHVLEGTLDNVNEPGFDASTFEHVITQLPRPEVCTDPAYLEAIVPPPTDPDIARRVAIADGELTRVTELAGAGKFERAEAILHDVDKAAPADPGLRVAIRYTTAIIARSRGDDEVAFKTLHDLYFEARALGERVTATHAASESALALLNLSRDAEADEWARLAEVEANAVPDRYLQMRTIAAIAAVANDRDQPARALELGDRAVRFGRAQHESVVLRDALQYRAIALDKLGHSERALADLDEAAQLVRIGSGDLHPELSSIAAAKVLILLRLGRTDEAVASAHTAVSIAEAIGSADVINNATSALGVALTRAGKFPEALALLDRSLATSKKLSGDKSYNVASDLNNRCDLLTQMRRFDEAVASGREAIAMWTELLGPDAGELGNANFNIALAQLFGGKPADARTSATRALEVMSKRKDNPDRPIALVVRGAARSALHAYPEARKDLDEAITALTAHPSDPTRLAWAQLELARIDAATGDPKTALTLALAARDALAAAKDDKLAEAEALIAKLR